MILQWITGGQVVIIDRPSGVAVTVTTESFAQGTKSEFHILQSGGPSRLLLVTENGERLTQKLCRSEGHAKECAQDMENADCSDT